MELQQVNDTRGPAPVRLAVSAQDGTIADARERAQAFLADLTRTVPPAGPRAVDDVLLAVSELVTNAVRHAPGPATLSLIYSPGQVQVTVQDTNPDAPTARLGDLRRGTGGFGWPAVQRLAQRVDITATPDGKAVHAFLPW